VLPFLPKFSYWINDAKGLHKSPYVLRNSTEVIDVPKPKPLDNRLVIPSIGVDQGVFQDGESSLDKGLWLRPQGVAPDIDGNVVIAGHRFTYKNPNGEFYNLDKVKPGDVIAIFWDQKEYNYVAREIIVVPANALYIEDPTDQPQLTLYTCTPVWSTANRLVVVADLIYKES
jgi:sortase A